MDIAGYEWVTHLLSATNCEVDIQQWFQDLWQDQRIDPDYLLLGWYEYRKLQRHIAGFHGCCGSLPDLAITRVLNQTTGNMVFLVQEDRLGYREVMALYKSREE